jgi:dolichol-phosphate mannosyltransferase
MTKVGMCIPVANEEETIDSFILQLLGFLKTRKEVFKVYIITDGSSHDRTLEILKKYQSKKLINLHVYTQSNGVVSCYLYGLRKAVNDGCDYIIEMDSGFSHPISHLTNIISKLESYDIVFSSRFIKGGGIKNMPLYRVFISKLATKLSNFMLKTNFSDMTGGYKGFTRKSLDQLLSHSYSQGGFWQVEMKYYSSTFNYCEIPYVYLAVQRLLNSTGYFPDYALCFV